MDNLNGEKNKGSFWSNLSEVMKAIIGIITAIGSLGGLLLVLSEIGMLDQFKPVQAPTATAVPKFGWAIYFEHELDEGYWKPGDNSYQFTVDCPDTEYFGDVDKLVEFSVDQNAELFPNETVELRFFGIPSPTDGDPKLSAINPEQKTKFTIGYANLSQEQAQLGYAECNAQIVVNGQWKLQLSPSEPAGW